MGEAREDVGFAAEPVTARLVSQSARVEELDGDFAIEVGIVRAPDFAHAAGTEA